MNRIETGPSFTRRVLVAVTGLSPQIVTETLYALAVARQPPWMPTELRLVTTAEGAHWARLKLLDAKAGQFHALCREYGLEGIAFGEEHIQVITDERGAPLADIQTPADNVRTADMLLATVRDLCADTNCELHVSIAGGRKSMGFFVGYALSLFGREQDRLSHVLVSPPFESHADFFFPPREPRVLQTRDGRPIHTADARITLAEIPFVRLREGLPREALAHATPFASLVALAQGAVDPPSLRIDLKARKVRCGQQEVVFRPAELAFYAWLAECRVAGRGEDGLVNFRNCDARDLLAAYERVVGPDSANLERAQERLREDFAPQYFQELRAKINRQLDRELGLGAAPYRIVAAGARASRVYGLALPKERISLSTTGLG